MERLRLENFALKHNLFQQQLQQNMAQRAECIRQIEAAHPGHHWQDDKGLVKIEVQ